VYRVIGDASELHHGDVVLACLPARVATLAHARGYIPGGGRCAGGTAPIGKIVMALPGDTVVVGPSGLAVNGATVQWSRPLDHDRGGRPLPRMSIGRSLVDARSVWLIGSSSHSFDSRYFGPVPISNVLVRVRPF
jgi:conjugative transfer signal peptidase TraF